VGYRVGTRPPHPKGIEAALTKLARASTGSLGHLTDFGYAIGLEALRRPQRAVGLAFTVQIPHLDATAVHYALNLIQPGEVLVIDTCGERLRACWGGVVAHAAMRAQVAAVVVDGPITDWEEIVATGPPVWCRGVSSITGRRLGLEGTVLLPVSVAGSIVQPGDVVFADTDGVFFINPRGVAHLADTLLTREAREPELKHRLDLGERMGDISGARQTFEEALLKDD
jgi:4-hydroxy-4-methyl-2-oxoglutarate aldolase